MKVSWTDRPKHHTDSYFERFVMREKSNDREGPWVIIQLNEFDCTLGLVSKGESCPLTDEICDDCGEEGNLRRIRDIVKCCGSAFIVCVSRAHTVNGLVLPLRRSVAVHLGS